MATKGTASKSANGASMSKYDVEVEARLNLIEARLAEMEVKVHSLTDEPEGLDKVVAALKREFPKHFLSL
jgi:peptidoglycan hydrolase CwlO-like protein